MSKTKMLKKYNINCKKPENASNLLLVILAANCLAPQWLSQSLEKMGAQRIKKDQYCLDDCEACHHISVFMKVYVQMRQIEREFPAGEQEKQNDCSNPI